MAFSTLLSLSEAASVVFLGLGSVWFSRKAASGAASAVELSRPTGNGFADSITAELAKQTRMLESIDDRVGLLDTRLTRLENPRSRRAAA
jgi:hypothetical protein